MTDRTHVPDKLNAYLLQVRHMLFELITLDLKTVVSTEDIDDVGIKCGEEVVAEQLKSVTTGSNPLSDRAEVFWKTIYNWCSYVAEGSISITNLRLNFIVVSERSLPCGNIPLSFAKASNVVEAKKALNEANYTLTHDVDGKEKPVPDSYSTYTDYIFAAENESITLAVIQALSITVYGRDYDDKLIEKFNSQQIPPEYADELLTYMLGWVTNEVHTQTRMNKPAFISARAFHDELLAQVRGRDLNTILTALSTEPSKAETTGEISKRDTYIKQLDFIELDPTEIFNAANDFIRTRTEKILWSERGLVTPQNFDDYNEKIARDWNVKKRLNDFQSFANDEAQGQSLYYSTLNSVGSFKLQGCDTPSFFGPGTLHSLANEPVIGWHPKYKELLEQEVADEQSNE